MSEQCGEVGLKLGERGRYGIRAPQRLAAALRKQQLQQLLGELAERGSRQRRGYLLMRASQSPHKRRIGSERHEEGK